MDTAEITLKTGKMITINADELCKDFEREMTDALTRECAVIHGKGTDGCTLIVPVSNIDFIEVYDSKDLETVTLNISHLETQEFVISDGKYSRFQSDARKLKGDIKPSHRRATNANHEWMFITMLSGVYRSSAQAFKDKWDNRIKGLEITIEEEFL